jgi:hypothetical protein
VDRLVAGRDPIVPHWIHGLGDVLVPAPLVAPFVATRLYRMRRDSRRSRRVAAQEQEFEQASSPLLSVLSRQPAPVASVGPVSGSPAKARAVLDQLCARGRAVKAPEAGTLDGRWSYAESPGLAAEAESLLDGWSFLEELATYFLEVAGPATRDDFAWWSGASGAAARRTIEELAGHVDEVDLEGGRKAHFMIEEDAAQLRAFVAPRSDHPALLPAFDAVRFGGRAGLGALASPATAPRVAPPARRRAGALSTAPRVALVGGAAVGTWAWSSTSGVNPDPTGSLDERRGAALGAESRSIESMIRGQLPWAVASRAI